MPRTISKPSPEPEISPVLTRSASLADVAALAGVSTGTVSRVLSKPEMISAETRTRVLAAVDRLGYLANGAARALAMKRTMTIGAIVPRFGGSSFPTMVQALESRLAAHGYTLLLSAPEHNRSKEPAILRTLLERGVDGVALLGEEQLVHALPMLTSSRTPYVVMWAPPEIDENAIGFDEHTAAGLLVDHLAGLGHRRIGFIGGSTDGNQRAQRRVNGVAMAIAKNGMTLCKEAMIETEYGFEFGALAMTRIISTLKGRQAVSAVVCGNDYLAAGALSALDHAGISVPGSLSVASFNDNDFCPYLHPPLTTVRLPIREIGEQAGENLIARLRGEPSVLGRHLDVSLVVRKSTGRRAANLA